MMRFELTLMSLRQSCSAFNYLCSKKKRVAVQIVSAFWAEFPKFNVALRAGPEPGNPHSLRQRDVQRVQNFWKRRNLHSLDSLLQLVASCVSALMVFLFSIYTS